jgi:anti-sigma regulatory factor (Ser/Thr protein kinase)
MTADPWPLHSHLELGALPTAVPCARLHVRQMAWEWGLDGLAETAELLISELITNAIKATHGRDRLPPVRLHLSSDKERLLIEVWDADPRPPAPARLEEDGLPALTDEGGRGLFLVAVLSQQWNWYPSREWGGKVVWCELQLTTGHGNHEHGTDPLSEGAPSPMSSPAPYSSTQHRPQAACAPAPGQASAPGMALPLRQQPAKADAKRWVPADPEILQRVKAALTRL